MDKWTWRETVASWFHRMAYKFSQEIANEVLLRDANGSEIFSIAFEGGFVATGPCSEDYTVHSREYENDEDLVGIVTDW